MIGDVLAACADRLGADATAVLSRLAGPVGDAARSAARDLAALDDAARKQRRAEIAAHVRSTIPAGLRAIHPTWIEHALGAMPAGARTAITGGSTTPLDVWLARWTGSSLPLPIARDELSAIIALEPPRILAWLRSIALDQLAFALGPAATTLALREAAARIVLSPRAGALGPQRAAIERCRGATLDEDVALVAIAGRALAPHLLQRSLARLQLTRRLPYTLGSALDREFVEYGAISVDLVPSWAALVAM